jgi:RNA polymerase sigma factor (TIGR02999 family)
MATVEPNDVTRLLKAWGEGDEAAFAELTRLLYEELGRLARRYSRNERHNNSLQTTAIVHEAWLRLFDAKDMQWQDRTHFLAVSANIIRRLLVDAARARAAEKRGGHLRRLEHSSGVNFDRLPVDDFTCSREFVALDDALNELAQLDPRKARVVELRFFGGLSVEETAESLQISPQSVMRDWSLARSWLMRELRK